MTTDTRIQIDLTAADVRAIEQLAKGKGDAPRPHGWIQRTYDSAEIDADGLLISGYQLEALEWYCRAAVLHPDDFATPVVRAKLAVALDAHGLTPIK